MLNGTINSEAYLYRGLRIDNAIILRDPPIKLNKVTHIPKCMMDKVTCRNKLLDCARKLIWLQVRTMIAVSPKLPETTKEGKSDKPRKHQNIRLTYIGRHVEQRNFER